MCTGLVYARRWRACCVRELTADRQKSFPRTVLQWSTSSNKDLSNSSWKQSNRRVGGSVKWESLLLTFVFIMISVSFPCWPTIWNSENYRCVPASSHHHSPLLPCVMFISISVVPSFSRVTEDQEGASHQPGRLGHYWETLEKIYLIVLF